MTHDRLRQVIVLLVACLLGGGISAADGELDAPGRAMLDPLRIEALRPELLIERLAIKPTAEIADVGAGPGFLTMWLARAAPRGHVTATDLRPDYLDVLRRRARESKLENITTRLAARDHPGLAPGSVDLIVLCQVDHYLGDRARFLGELAAALRPDGRIVVVNYTQYRPAIVAAANAASLESIDTWEPSPALFMNVFRHSRRAP